MSGFSNAASRAPRAGSRVAGTGLPGAVVVPAGLTGVTVVPPGLTGAGRVVGLGAGSAATGPAVAVAPSSSALSRASVVRF